MYRVEQIRNDSEWDEYIHLDKTAALCHLAAWRGVLKRTFRHKSFYIVVKENDLVRGTLPLILIKSRVFGRFLISMPFLNYGGICAEKEQAAKLLMEEAIVIAKAEKVDYIELRQSGELNLGLPVKKSKVTMVLELKSNPEDMWKTLDPKVRNQIRRAQKANLRLETGSLDQIKHFYKVFSHNMRDLGTPVYGKNFFENIARGLFDRARIFSVFLDDVVLASGFTIGYKDSLEIPWASSLRKHNKLCPNTLLYWEIVKYACENGYKYFDFGRCSMNSGTYHFKKQWGAAAKQLYWYYWLPDGRQLPELNPANPKYRLLIAIWQRLPLAITQIIGPRIAGYIP